MCGLVGCAGILDFASEKAFRNLLILDSLRGEDSTGIASVKKNSEDVTVVKAVGDPFRLFETRRFDKVMAQGNRVLIGHNRYATTGSVSASNAHPF